MISNDQLPLLEKLTSKEQANRLPSHSSFDHSMIFKPGSKIPNGPLYRLTWEEEEALMRYLDQMTMEGKIRLSGSISYPLCEKERWLPTTLCGLSSG